MASSNEHSRAVVMASGGLDSTVSLAIAHKTMDVRLVLFFAYGQRSLASERAAVVALAGYYGLPMREVDLSWLEGLAPEGMRSGADPGADGLRHIDDVWVPNRNGVFLNVAAAFAEAYRCQVVVAGFNREEAEEFPDNSSEYVRRLSHALELSTRAGVRVESPTLEMDKRQILRAGLGAGAPLSTIWSCYRSGARMCGTCASCARLKAALASLTPGERPVIEFAEEA